MYVDRKYLKNRMTGMNAKTAKILGKFATFKGVSEKQLKREWQGLSQFDKDKKRQEILKELVKK
ncbi:hypothetical protein LPTSP3_g02000 [Leptospira kobayashii]|uniref:Uncharacterized protein n=1 Tax=Leptospira kobayashii TaxID=1917830 RepID=A0ABM7UFE5_9LEPT|nr:hypothetical protein [Leptospira ilyithenensis]BDA77270.1 hypothetical protein LPTSP3_g02000 [Leptospira kobayashii]